MDKGLIEWLARELLAKYERGVNFRRALRECAQIYVASYPDNNFGNVMSKIAKAARARKARRKQVAKPVQLNLF